MERGPPPTFQALLDIMEMFSTFLCCIAWTARRTRIFSPAVVVLDFLWQASRSNVRSRVHQGMLLFPKKIYAIFSPLHFFSPASSSSSSSRVPLCLLPPPPPFLTPKPLPAPFVRVGGGLFAPPPPPPPPPLTERQRQQQSSEETAAITIRRGRKLSLSAHSGGMHA